MKKILLSSAAIVAFAGAAAAEVTFSGDAELGYNDDFENGVYWDLGLTLGLSQELNNGWTVSGSLDIDIDDDDDDGDLAIDPSTGLVQERGTAYSLGDIDASDFVLTLSNDMFAISAGDVDTAYASFSGVSALYDNAFFAPNDEAADYADSAAGILVTADYGMFDAAVSYVVYDQDAGETGVGNLTNGDLDSLQLTLGAELGMIDLGLFYDDGVAGGLDEMTVVNLGTTLGGAELDLSVMDYMSETGYGIGVSYPVGAVTLGAYYADYDTFDAYGISADYVDGPLTLSAYFEKDMDDSDEYGIGGTYDFGMGLVVTAGYIDGDDDGVSGFGDDDDFASYIVAEYDLGGGASFLASYADANSVAAESTDDIDTVTGGYELYSGGTLALSFSF